MKTITINPDEKFYAAIGEYRTLHASPKYIIESKKQLIILMMKLFPKMVGLYTYQGIINGFQLANMAMNIGCVKHTIKMIKRRKYK